MVSNLPSINSASYAETITRHLAGLKEVDKVRINRYAAVQKVERIVVLLLDKKNDVSHKGKLNSK